MGCASSTQLGTRQVAGDGFQESKDCRDISASPCKPSAAQKHFSMATAAQPAAPAIACHKPPNEAERLQALLDCKLLDTPSERRFDSITNLLKDMLQVPIVVVSLIDSDRLWFKSVAGVKCRQADRLHSFCDISLRARNPTATVVPDTLLDARFQHNQFVAGPPYVRFCAGCPLVSSDGHILGTLGVMDIKPRKFAPGTLNLLCNFGELVVREMEREQALERLYQEAESAKSVVNVAARQFSARALSCFEEAVVLCDTSIAGWPVLYTNDRWCAATGLGDERWLDTCFWSAFKSERKAQACDATALCASFTIAVTGRDGRRLTLELRPATQDNLSAASPAIGIPNFVEGLLSPEEDQALRSLYFAVLSPGAPPAAPAVPAVPAEPRPRAPSLSSASSAEIDHAARAVFPDSGSFWGGTSGRSSDNARLDRFGLHCPEDLLGIQIGPQVGSGSCGRVFRGTDAAGAAVAVKVVDTWVPVGTAKPSKAQLEALLSQDLRHPNVVLTTKFAVCLMEEPSACEAGGTVQSAQALLPEGWSEEEQQCGTRMAPGKQQQQLWMVQEYCDRGTLSDAVDRGWLRTRRTQEAPPHLLAVLLTAQEVAGALAYLHSRSVLHGDLTPGNVLLCKPPPKSRRHPRDPRGFQAKVADFGLSRVLDGGEVKTVTCGTVTHMPMELINDQLLTKAADVFSFGVLLYEMLAGHRAWAGRNTTQILYARTIAQQKLEVPCGCPPGLRALVEACLSEDHTQRPTFGEIQDRLALLLATTD